MSPATPATVGEALSAAAERLTRAGVDAPRLAGEMLLARLLGTDRGGLLLRRDEPLEATLARGFDDWVERRARREPLQHITGQQEFHGLAFKVDRRALVPRPETEGLVDAVLEGPETRRVADLGTGGGCIAIALAVRRPGLRLHALDASAAALDLARENARAHGVLDRVEFALGDLAFPPPSWQGRMDAVVSNPPYVGEAEWSGLAPEVRDHDPREALVAGETGLEAYAALAPAAGRLLRPGGVLMLELGWGQSAAVVEIVARAGFEAIEVRPDLRGIARVLVARDGRGGL